MNKTDFNIINFETIDSTSTYLKRSYKQLDNLTIVFSDHQSNGHGRMEREWVSPKGDSLLFSILFKDKKIINNFASLSLMSACMVKSFLEQYVDNVSIKWPNDVYVNSKKICGILLEGVSINNQIDAVILGIGININIKDFNDELKNKATSLFKETNKVFDIDILKDSLINYISELINQIENDDKSYLEIVRKNNFLRDKEVLVLINGSEEKAKVIDVNDDNTLLVLKDNNLYSISIGEVICLQ